jgi:hypothetical protein
MASGSSTGQKERTGDPRNLIHSCGLEKRRGKRMSIRELAKELYRLEQEARSLEERSAKLPPMEREALEPELARAKAERDRYRKIMKEKKEK